MFKRWVFRCNFYSTMGITTWVVWNWNETAEKMYEKFIEYAMTKWIQQMTDFDKIGGKLLNLIGFTTFLSCCFTFFLGRHQRTFSIQAFDWKRCNGILFFFSSLLVTLKLCVMVLLHFFFTLLGKMVKVFLFRLITFVSSENVKAVRLAWYFVGFWISFI